MLLSDQSTPQTQVCSLFTSPRVLCRAPDADLHLFPATKQPILALCDTSMTVSQTIASATAYTRVSGRTHGVLRRLTTAAPYPSSSLPYLSPDRSRGLHEAACTTPRCAVCTPAPPPPPCPNHSNPSSSNPQQAAVARDANSSRFSPRGGFSGAEWRRVPCRFLTPLMGLVGDSTPHTHGHRRLARQAIALPGLACHRFFSCSYF